jgi:hypothetical protein
MNVRIHSNLNMESALLGVIPAKNSEITFIALSLCKTIAVGIDFSVYVFDTVTGENVARVNHYPHKTIAADWHPNKFMIISVDISGEAIITDLTTMSCKNKLFGLGVISLHYHLTMDLVLVLKEEKTEVYDCDSFEKVKEIGTGGKKILMDYFSPLKVLIVGENSVKVVRNILGSCKTSEGKIEGIIDAVINPSVINMLFVLKTQELVEYDYVLFT